MKVTVYLLPTEREDEHSRVFGSRAEAERVAEEERDALRAPYKRKGGKNPGSYPKWITQGSLSIQSAPVKAVEIEVTT